MKIYTKTGDAGTTRLGNGEKVLKNDLSVEALGSVDELNSVLGIICSDFYTEKTDTLRKIQSDLFEIGAELCFSKSKYERAEEDIAFLEAMIDFYEKDLKPLRNFILPGGNRQSAWFHHARTICRRAERNVISFFQELENKKSDYNKKIIVYLNRLSDLLFVMARDANRKAGTIDILWKHNGN